VPDGATAATLNITAVDAQAAGYLTAWPCDQPQPLASTVNYTAGPQAIPNAAAVKVAANGTVCIASFTPVHVIVDRAGWYGATGAGYQPTTPTRILDTRTGTGAPNGKHPAETTLTLTVPGLPAAATAVVINLTATEPDAAGFLTAWPCGQPRPLASNVNFAAEQRSAPNHAAVTLGPDHQICIAGNTTTHIITDLNGVFLT
jgi:hypothetical protein